MDLDKIIGRELICQAASVTMDVDSMPSISLKYAVRMFDHPKIVKDETFDIMKRLTSNEWKIVDGNPTEDIIADLRQLLNEIEYDTTASDMVTALEQIIKKYS